VILTVLGFALLLAIFETVVLWPLPTRILKAKAAQWLIHWGFFALALAIHWGTLTGTMAATAAFLVSVVSLPQIIKVKESDLLSRLSAWWSDFKDACLAE
jgi:hypothetical protein